MIKAEQGDLLSIANIKHTVLVVSNNTFNESGSVMVCAVVRNAEPGPVHIKLQTPEVEGYALCEQLKLIDLTARRFSKLGAVLHYDVLNVADAVMSIFEYQII